MVKGAGPEHVVGVEGERVDPVPVARQCPAQLALENEMVSGKGRQGHGMSVGTQPHRRRARARPGRPSHTSVASHTLMVRSRDAV